MLNIEIKKREITNVKFEIRNPKSKIRDLKFCFVPFSFAFLFSFYFKISFFPFYFEISFSLFPLLRYSLFNIDIRYSFPFFFLQQAPAHTKYFRPRGAVACGKILSDAFFAKVRRFCRTIFCLRNIRR